MDFELLTAASDDVQDLTFDVFVDHHINGIEDIVRVWLGKALWPDMRYFPTSAPLQTLAGLPAGVVSVCLARDSLNSLALISGSIDMEKIALNIKIVRLYDSSDTTITARYERQLMGEADEHDIPFRWQMLPSPSLLSSWKDLVFEPAIHDQILQALQRTVQLMLSGNGAHNSSPPYQMADLFHGLILLWGPPGSGKSSLCRAVTQSLAISCQASYPETLLLEIDAHGMHSKFFGESAQLVQTAFEKIATLLKSRDPPLVCVLIDEIESLATSRDNSLGSGGEPGDAMRALNALLTSVDRLRKHKNLLVFCTSNLVNAMDKAFLDRFDFKWHIPVPTVAARYEILRRQYLKLLKSGQMEAGLGLTRLDMYDIFPPYKTLALFEGDDSKTLARRLGRLAALSEGVSARSLCKLPWTSLVFQHAGGDMALIQALDALEIALLNEPAA